MTNHVILGAGPAGVTAAETLRKHNPDATITLISAEPEQPYSRMALPYLLAENIEESGTHLRQTEGHYDTLNIAYLQARCEKVDPQSRTLHLETGDHVAYDNLLIATGATPISPPIPGADHAVVHPCWTMEDTRWIQKRAAKGAPVVLVGAGFIGCIILEALHERGVDLTVIEQGDRMVPRMMDQTAGGLLKRWCEERGVRVLTDTTVTEIKSGDDADHAVVSTNTGEQLPARLVVMAVGVRSNIGFLDGSGVETDQGILVDEYMQSSVPGIYAAGDCAQAKDLSTGQRDVLAVQPVAVEHARHAAMNMAGIPTPLNGSLNMNVLDTLGLISTSFGLWDGVAGGERATSLQDDAYKYLRLEFSGDKLVGAQGVGHTEAVGIARGLIQSGIALGDWKDKLIAEPQRLPEAYISVTQDTGIGLSHAAA